MDKGSSTVGIAVGVVIALIVGGIGGYAIGMNNDKDSNDSSATTSMSEDKPSTMTKAADVRVTLNQQMRQHVELATIALKQTAAGAPDAKAAVKALDNNTVELSETIGSVYGDKPQSDFLDLWRKHIGFFVDYTNGVVEGDEAAQEKAKNDLKGYTEDASTFFSEATGVDKADLKKGLQTHADQVVGIVDDYAAKDYTAMFEEEDKAYDHIGAAADQISAAIVKQNPDKF